MYLVDGGGEAELQKGVKGATENTFMYLIEEMKHLRF